MSYKLHVAWILPVACIGMIVAPVCLFAQKQATIEQHQYEGTLGESRIGMTVLRVGDKIEGGHYFYQKSLQDIPIRGTFDGSGVTLMEPGQGVFHLHFVGNGSNGGRPLDFRNSVGISGTWTSTDGTRSYPVSLHGTIIRPGLPDSNRYRDVTRESNAKFEKRVQSFWWAALRGDKASAVRFISYPFIVTFSNGTNESFQNAGEVWAAWERLFPPVMIRRLDEDLPHDMFVRNGMAMLGNGEAWFDAKGLAVWNIIDAPRMVPAGRSQTKR